jgi:putative PIN family toxin of toxin-antitoxin system
MRSTKKRFRVFIDTNILLSGIIYEGNGHKVLNLSLEGKTDLILAEYTIKEAQKVFSKEFPKYLHLLDKALKILKYKSVKIPKKKTMDRYLHYTRDITDLPIIVSALNAKPDYFITGDKDFFTKELMRELRVVTCREFLNAFEQESNMESQ